VGLPNDTRYRLLIAAVVTAGLAACHSSPELTPPSAHEVIDASSQALADLYDQECIHHRNFGWVQKESERIEATCGGLVGKGEASDCRDEVAGRVEWVVPTKSGGGVLVEVSWDPGAPKSAARCSLSVGPMLTAALAQAADKIAAPHALRTRTPIEAEGPTRSDVLGQWAARSVALQRSHTLILEGSSQPFSR
jgi:hypothetical protein